MPMPGQTWESSTSDCQNVTQTALMPIHNYVEITALNSDFLSILGASLTTAPLAFKVTATPPNQGFSYNIAPVVPNLAQQIKIYFHAPTPFILNYKVAQSGCSLPMNTIPPGTKNYTIYFTPCNLNAIQLSITAPSVFATTTIVIDSIVKDSISFTPELVITKVCDEGVYEYGFNGKLKDDEWAGKGNHLDYGFRREDTRIARFNSVDPLTKQYPWYTPYQFAGNTPIQAVDVDGLEPASVVQKGEWQTDYTGKKIFYRNVDDFKLTKPAIHLLSLVSGVAEDDLNKVSVWNGFYGLFRFSNSGGMTYPDGNGGYKIILSGSYFDIKSIKFPSDESNSTIDWLNILSHEVNHIKDIQDINRGAPGYMAIFAGRYFKAYLLTGHPHDGCPEEIRADANRNYYFQFKSFVRTIHKNIGSDYDLMKLFDDKNLSDQEKILKIDAWYKAFKDELNFKEESKSKYFDPIKK